MLVADDDAWARLRQIVREELAAARAPLPPMALAAWATSVGISLRHARRLVAAGKLPVLRPSPRKVLVDVAKLEGRTVAELAAARKGRR